MTNQLILVGGGVRSGKSTFALARARSLGARRVFVATAQAFDDEMRDRIALHRNERGDEFRTIEEPLAVAQALAALDGVDVVLVDCLTLWLSNLLLREMSTLQIFERVDELVAVLAQRRFHSVIVTNEVGMGIVPESALGRAFRDIAGIAHQRIARHADEIDVAILGTVLRIKPAPVQIQEGEARETSK
ncbi:MAG TPA: bifunctional adenosylcobinamide kinase/adenosylcobinamide-phosphate guanylyltransferase [Kofleriaceae bacterium]|nr:bifunctional adenosylcobinamide kinase/adenosylcobinamide-phosphate guanylyltransferase [Kofleriaceae bacterium]